MLTLFIDKQCLKSLNLPCLDHHIQLLDMAITRLCFVLDLGKKKKKKKIVFTCYT